MSDIQSFPIEATDQQLSDLKARLEMTRWPDKETPEDWTQGIPLEYMKDVHDYWLNSYDWKKREALINQFPGYKTEVDGLGIHFLHVRSPNENARPLIMTHGWPGSVIEFQKVIGPLTDPAAHGGDPDNAFHLVCPTLPGFGHSDKPTAPGWGIEKTATAWNSLMLKLGYDAYYAQGGDWGSIVTSEIGIQDLGNCKGIHITMPIVAPDPDTMHDLSDLEQRALRMQKFYQDEDSGYSKQQGTRPQTLGYGLADSPIGQAAWILEKFYQWMDCDGLPENVVSRDELLDNVMIYWLTDAAASSARIYWENARGTSNRIAPITMPVGISVFPKEIFQTSERWAAKRFSKLVHFEDFDKGGHFSAFERPEVFVQQVRSCFSKMSL